MEIDSRLLDITNLYDVDLTEESQSEGYSLVTITDRSDALLTLAVQYKDDEPLNVYFLNNQYYELPDKELYECVVGILSGNYKVKKPLLGSRPSVVIRRVVGEDILPERLTDGIKFLEEYRTIPKAFAKR